MPHKIIWSGGILSSKCIFSAAVSLEALLGHCVCGCTCQYHEPLCYDYYLKYIKIPVATSQFIVMCQLHTLCQIFITTLRDNYFILILYAMKSSEWLSHLPKATQATKNWDQGLNPCFSDSCACAFSSIFHSCIKASSFIPPTWCKNFLLWPFCFLALLESKWLHVVTPFLNSWCLKGGLGPGSPVWVNGCNLG